MPVYIADTHALIWRLVAPDRLGARASDAFDKADAGQAEICVPAVVLAEMVMVAEKGRVPGWGLDEVRCFARAAKASTNYHLSILTPELVMTASDLPVIPDIFDRLIAAEALGRAAILISRDQTLAAARDIEVRWA